MNTNVRWVLTVLTKFDMFVSISENSDISFNISIGHNLN